MIDTRPILRWFSGCLEAFDTLLYPMECLICGDGRHHAPFCPGCREELHDASGRSCGRCAMPIGPWEDRDGGCSECRDRALGFDGAVALGPYQGPIRDVCLRLKHERNGWLAPWAADLLVEARGETLRSLERDACVVPIPLHWKRRLARGYNQAEALALPLARRLGLPLAQPLRRVEATPNLARLGRVERAKLMRYAFRTRSNANLRGRTVLLVDDILTTGATSGSAARALKRAGAQRVVVAVIGRAEGRV